MESKLSREVMIKTEEMIQIKEESLEESFERIEIKDEAIGMNDISCEIVPKKEEPGDQTIVEVSDDDDCVIVTFRCDSCPRSFLMEKDLNKHKERHSWPFVCTTCKRRFLSKSVLNSHKQSKHVLQKIHECPTCRKKFRTRAGMKEHKKYHDKNRPKAFNCEFCEFACDGKKKFKMHKKIHLIVPKIEPKTEFKEEPVIFDDIRVKEEPKVFLFGAVKTEMDS